MMMRRRGRRRGKGSRLMMWRAKHDSHNTLDYTDITRSCSSLADEADDRDDDDDDDNDDDDLLIWDTIHDETAFSLCLQRTMQTQSH